MIRIKVKTIKKNQEGIMLKKSLILLLVGCFSLIFAQKSSTDQKNSDQLKNYTDTISYILGRDVGAQLKSFDTELNSAQFYQGFQSALKGEKARIDSVKVDSIRQQFAIRVQEKIRKDEDSLAASNKKTSELFLSSNKNKPDIKTTESGLQYRIITKGNGPKPKKGDSVYVEYKGMFADSTVFDSSGSKPVLLDLEKTIPGFAEGIRLMNSGSTYQFFIPPNLAYGSQGALPRIPPNAVLIFTVKLEKIKNLK
jgi:FKBP-type peptidyl-prolyl cis-trans isomerase